MSVVIEMKLYISLKGTIIIIKFKELSKVVLENLQYLPFLQLQPPMSFISHYGAVHWQVKTAGAISRCKRQRLMILS